MEFTRYLGEHNDFVEDLAVSFEAIADALNVKKCLNTFDIETLNKVVSLFVENLSVSLH